MPKRSSLVENMTQKIELMMRSVRSSDGGMGNSVASYPNVDFYQSELLEEQYDHEEVRTESKKWEKDKIMRKLDSIKRAMTDIYRTAKRECILVFFTVLSTPFAAWHTCKKC